MKRKNLMATNLTPMPVSGKTKPSPKYNVLNAAKSPTSSDLTKGNV